MSEDEISSLLETSAYNADSIPKLEKYVDAQISGAAPYNLCANRTLAKLYQFFPGRSSSSDHYIAQILILSLLAYPSSDLLSLLCLISEKVQETETVALIIRCFNLIDSCKFKEFWTEFKKLEESNMDLKSICNSSATTQKLQSGIAQVLAISYRSAPLSVIKVALNTTSSDIISGVPEVESVSQDDVTFVATADNTKRNRVFQQGVQFSSIASLVAKSQ
mmetsp:Transcript_31422/g.47502  ORF Transcript_31422/g.47502 Transcript_31422/m.47502 type:complete len:220 (+) Transcript_31422:86-745(+)